MNPGKVTKILITHWHADHVLGLTGLMKTLEMSGYNKTLYLYGPKGFKKHMKNLFETFGWIKKYSVKIEEVKGKFFENDDFYLESKEMIHGVRCNAYSFVEKDQIRINKLKIKKSNLPSGPLLQKLKEGKNILYNGKKYFAKDLTYLEKGKKISFIFDTLINNKAILLAKNSDVLISEATFSEDDKDKAKEHEHLTGGQAATIAKKSKSKKLILAHISQRYEKKPKKILDEAKKIFKNVFLVKDLDVIEV